MGAPRAPCSSGKIFRLTLDFKLCKFFIQKNNLAMQVLHSKIIIRRVKIECAPSKCSSNRRKGEFRKPMHPVQGRQEQEGTEGEGSLNGRKIQACVVIIINGNRSN